MNLLIITGNDKLGKTTFVNGLKKEFFGRNDVFFLKSPERTLHNEGVVNHYLLNKKIDKEAQQLFFTINENMQFMDIDQKNVKTIIADRLNIIDCLIYRPINESNKHRLQLVIENFKVVMKRLGIKKIYLFKFEGNQPLIPLDKKDPLESKWKDHDKRFRGLYRNMYFLEMVQPVLDCNIYTVDIEDFGDKAMTFDIIRKLVIKGS